MTKQTSEAETDQETFLVGWSDNDHARLLLHTEPRRFRAGDLVIDTGEVDRSLYIIVDGTLEAFLPRGAGVSPRRLSTLGAGSVIGELGFVDGRPRSASVKALSDGALLRLSMVEFEAFAAREPRLALAFLFDLGRILSLRLRRRTEDSGSRAEPPPLRVASSALLPLQRVEIDQAERTRRVAEITDTDFFQGLQQLSKQLRRDRADPATG